MTARVTPPKLKAKTEVRIILKNENFLAFIIKDIPQNTKLTDVPIYRKLFGVMPPLNRHRLKSDQKRYIVQLKNKKISLGLFLGMCAMLKREAKDDSETDTA